MEKATPENFSGRNKRLTVAYFLSRMSHCAKNTRRVIRNLKSRASRKIHQHCHLQKFSIPRLTCVGVGRGCLPKDLAAKIVGRKNSGEAEAADREEDHGGGCVSKELLTTISGKAANLIRQKKQGDDGGGTEAEDEDKYGSDGGWGQTRSTAAEKEEKHDTGAGRRKELLKKISGKAKTLVRRKKDGNDGGVTVEKYEEEEGGIWQKAILMGDRCEPLDFAGVIYYDCEGRQLKEPPYRSPRRSPLPGI